jgi:hypothetical protein
MQYKSVFRDAMDEIEKMLSLEREAEFSYRSGTAGLDDSGVLQDPGLDFGMVAAMPKSLLTIGIGELSRRQQDVVGAIPNATAYENPAAKVDESLNRRQAPHYSCVLSDGTVVGYEPWGRAGTGAVAGQAIIGVQQPSKEKLGGVAGGGASGRATSPASATLRAMTGNQRWKPLRSITGTSSVGGSIARLLPWFGGGLAVKDALDYATSQSCKPIA